jgi:hypothetical protein
VKVPLAALAEADTGASRIKAAVKMTVMKMVIVKLQVFIYIKDPDRRLRN